MAATRTPDWATEMLARHWKPATPASLPPLVRFDTRELKARLGQTQWASRKNGWRTVISIQGAHTRPLDDLQATMRHEIAHVLAGPIHGHGPVFRAQLRALEHADGVQHDARYTEWCGQCGGRVKAAVEAFHVGQRVAWKHGRERYAGLVIGVNRLTLRVRADNGTLWRVGRDVDLETPGTAVVTPAAAVFVAPPPRSAPPAEPKKHTHAWIVDRVYEETRTRSASGRAEYWERDHHCSKCGLRVSRAKWSRTVK